MSSEDFEENTNAMGISVIDQEANIYRFAELMINELNANEGKGNFSNWIPDKKELLREMDHHLNKFKLALATDDCELITEYAADIANYCMKAYQIYGEEREENSDEVEDEEY